MKYNMEKRCISLISLIQKKVVEIINTNFNKIDELANYLLKKKRLFQNDINKILGKDIKNSEVIYIYE